MRTEAALDVVEAAYRFEGNDHTWREGIATAMSLVDVFDSDGRAFVVARRNAPQPGVDLRLTRRERQAVALAATGHTERLAGYAPGVRPSTIGHT